MTKVRLVFPSLFMLWDFRQVFRDRVVETNCRRRALVCYCSESEIELAVYAYRAKVTSAEEALPLPPQPEPPLYLLSPVF